MREITADCGSVPQIGIRHENGRTVARISLKSIMDMVESHPGGSYTLAYRRRLDDQFYVSDDFTVADGYLEWTVGSHALAVAGDVTVQVSYATGSITAETPQMRFTVGKSIFNGENGQGENLSDLVEAAITAAGGISEALNEAREELDAKVTAAQTARGAAEAAQTAAERAQHTAENAKTSAAQSANAAYNFAADANTAKRDSVNAKTDAVQAKEDAVVAQRAAEDAEDSANTSALKSEGYAVGTQNGTPAGSGEPYYQDNAKYYKEQAAAAKTAAEAARDTAQQTVAGIETAGTAQVQRVTAEGATQVGNVQTKGQQVLDSIPDDYSELSGEVTELKIALNVLTIVTSDNVDSIKDHIDTGKNLLPYDTTENVISNLSVKYENGKIIRNGTAGSAEVYQIISNKPISLYPGNYRFWSINPITNTIFLRDASKTIIYWANRDGFTLTSPQVLFLGIRIAANWSGNNTVSVMLEKGDVDTAYEDAISGTAIDNVSRTFDDNASIGIVDYICERTLQMYNAQSVLQNETATLHFYKVKIPTGTKSVFYNAENIGSTPSHWYNEYDENNNLLYTATINISGATTYKIDIHNPDTIAYIKISVWTDQGELQITNQLKNIIFDSSFKLMSAIGDSITYGYSSTGNVEKTYLNLIAENFGINYQNLGISSTPVCPNSDYTGGQNANAFVYRFSAISVNADLIVIAGGTNDFRHNVPLGVESDDDTKYEQTFYGACDYLIKNIIENHLTAKIVWITPFHQSGDTSANSAGYTLTQYINAIKNKCEKYGITCIDGYANSGINLIPAFVTECIPDSLHPNQAGHNLIYKNLMPYFAMM